MSIEEQNRLIEESTVAQRVTNALLLGEALGVDVTKPLELQKVLRYLSVIENAVRRDLND